MRVVLPWSTWAMTATLRRRLGSREAAGDAADAAGAAGAAAKARERKREGAKGGGDFLVEDQRERRRRGATMFDSAAPWV